MGALHTKVWINPFMCVYVHPSLHCIVYKGVKVKYILKISQQDVSFLFTYYLEGHRITQTIISHLKIVCFDHI